MIIYNVTTKVTWSIHRNWLEWMKDEYIPLMLATRVFVDYRMVRLLETDDSDGPTYAVQYVAPSLDAYHQYVSDHATNTSLEETVKWGNNFVQFSTVMEVVHP